MIWSYLISPSVSVQAPKAFIRFLLIDTLCLVEDGCEQWTYWADSRRCYLKSSNDSTEDAISGTVGCSSGTVLARKLNLKV